MTGPPRSPGALAGEPRRGCSSGAPGTVSSSWPSTSAWTRARATDGWPLAACSPRDTARQRQRQRRAGGRGPRAAAGARRAAAARGADGADRDRAATVLAVTAAAAPGTRHAKHGVRLTSDAPVDVFDLLPQALMVCDHRGRMVESNAQLPADARAGRQRRSPMTCCGLFGCGRADGPLPDGCLTTVALATGESVRELRLQLPFARSGPYVVTGAPLHGDPSYVVFELRPVSRSAPAAPRCASARSAGCASRTAAAVGRLARAAAGAAAALPGVRAAQGRSGG